MKNGIEDIPFFGNFPTPLTDSVSSVLSMIESINEGNGVFLTLQEGTEISRKIRSHLNIDPMLSQQISFLMRFNSMQIKTIPERIKDKVLEWACDLEVAGVRGDGMSFSAKEKEIAHNTTFNIFNSIIDQLNNNGTNQKD